MIDQAPPHHGDPSDPSPPSAPDERAPGQVLEALDARALRRWALLVLGRLEEHREAIDALNVFPVPDGDTGTNLYSTWASAVEATTGGGDGSAAVQIGALARATFMAARGNSGVLLGQLVGGLAEAVADIDPAAGIGPDTLARAFVLADERAWSGVSDPVEGTILSVARVAAQGAAAAASHGLPLAEVTAAALGGAQSALAATPAQLSSLARAGVVDAGGAGLVVILAALHEVVTGERVRVPIPAAPRRALEQVPGHAADARAHYEVMYHLVPRPATPERAVAEADTDIDAVAELRAALAAIGDSVVVGGRHDHTTVHVHTGDAGRAVEIGLARGTVSDIRIDVLPAGAHPASPEPSADVWRTDDTPAPGAVGPTKALGVVACAPSAALAALFAEAGALVVTDGPGCRATPQAVLDAIRATGAPDVVVLPNHRDTRMSSEAAATLAREHGIRAEVLDTDSPVQSVAALALYDPGADPAATSRAMAEAAAAVRVGRVVLATRRALTDAGWCEPGDALGIVADEVVVVDADPIAVAVHVVAALAGTDGELLTLVSGDGAQQLGADVADRMSELRPDLEVTVLRGDQPVHTLLVGVE